MNYLSESLKECEAALKRLEGLFQPECRLTLIVRSDFDADADIAVTKDDLKLVEQAIVRLKERDITFSNATLFDMLSSKIEKEGDYE